MQSPARQQFSSQGAPIRPGRLAGLTHGRLQFSTGLKMLLPGLMALLALSTGGASAQTYERHQGGYPVPVPVPVPTPGIGQRQDPDRPMVTTSANTCTCQVAETSGSACMIFLRTNAADWLAKNAPQTALRSSNNGRFYDTPFAVAASACAGRKVAPGSVKVHWLDRKNAILEWK